MREIEIKMDITLVLTESAVKKNWVILYVELNENIREVTVVCEHLSNRKNMDINRSSKAQNMVRVFKH